LFREKRETRQNIEWRTRKLFVDCSSWTLKGIRILWLVVKWNSFSEGKSLSSSPNDASHQFGTELYNSLFCTNLLIHLLY